MQPLRIRLARAGFDVRCFSYPTLGQDPGESAAALARFCGAGQPQLVGHSLGGLVILRMLAARGRPWAGRVVLLGSPLMGSRVAQRLGNFGPATALLGRSAELLTRGVPDALPDLECGMVAGTRNAGLGRLSGARIEAGDGTVALEETHHPVVSERVELPVSHTGMLLSAQVAGQVAAFLESGHFSPA